MHRLLVTFCLTGCSVAQPINSVVMIHQGNYGGAGWVYDDNTIVTCAHMFQADLSDELKITTLDGREFSVKPYKINQAWDILLLKADLGLPSLQTGNAIVGDKVTIIGNPAGLDWHISNGTIGSMSKDYYYLDANITFGNSGGPMIKDCKVIGMLVGLVDNIGIAVSSERIEKMMKGNGN